MVQNLLREMTIWGGGSQRGGDFLPILFFVNRFMYTILQVQIHYIDILLLAIMYIYNMSVDFIL